MKSKLKILVLLLCVFLATPYTSKSAEKIADQIIAGNLNDSILLAFVAKIEPLRYENPALVDSLCGIIILKLEENNVKESIIALIHTRRAYANLSLMKLNTANQISDKAVNIFEKEGNYSGLGAVYNLKALTYAYLGAYKSAAEHFILSADNYLKSIEQDNNEEGPKNMQAYFGYAQTVTNLANAYLRLGEYEKADKYSKLVIDFVNHIPINDKSEVKSLIGRITFEYYERNNLNNEAIEYFLSMKDFLTERDNDGKLLHINYIFQNSASLIKIAHKIGQLDELKSIFKEIFKTHMVEHSESFIMAQIHLFKRNFNQALTESNKAFDYYLEVNFLDEALSVLKLRLEIYKQMNNYKGQIKALLELMDFEKKQLDKDDSHLEELVRAEFDEKILSKEIDYYQKTNALLQEQLKNQNIFKGLVIALILIVSVLLTYLFFSANRLSKQKETLIKNNKTLKENNLLRDQIFSIAGHDLRIPFNNLQQVIALLELEKTDKEEKNILLKEVKNRADNTLLILQNLLNWSVEQRSEKKGAISTVNLDSAIKQISTDLATQIESKNIIILNNVPQHLTVNNQPEILNIAIRNVLSNAIKFSNLNGEIELSGWKENDFVVLMIKDHGLGMNQEMVNQLNQDNPKIKQRKGTNNELGTGLGISLVKLQLNKLESQIWFESEENRGTTAIIKFKNLQ
jgi:signal transduction histidine kinase